MGAWTFKWIVLSLQKSAVLFSSSDGCEKSLFSKEADDFNFHYLSIKLQMKTVSECPINGISVFLSSTNIFESMSIIPDYADKKYETWEILKTVIISPTLVGG